MVCSGEAMPRALADSLLDKGAELWNFYGPTETTVWSSGWRVEPGDGPISIGRPIANTRLYVLNHALDLVPVGVTGELYIGGDGLARGYTAAARALTADRFVSSPFRGAEARLYRTGDLVRWQPEGQLEFLGRQDDQVKIRGFRVELGEIEAVLRQCPGVIHGVVLLREDRQGDPRLVGYYVPANDHSLTRADLARHAREKLPEYMVPSAFIPLERLPLSANGKVDRRALPAPDQARPDLDAAYVAPRTPWEERLAEIWEEVLGLDRVGIHDNFFDLGGHSLLAMRVIARANSVLGVELALRGLFETPTIAALAAHVGAQRAGGGDPARTRLARLPRDDGRAIPLSFAQQRLWILEQLEGNLAYYNIPSAWRIQGPWISSHCGGLPPRRLSGGMSHCARCSGCRMGSRSSGSRLRERSSCRVTIYATFRRRIARWRFCGGPTPRPKRHSICRLTRRCAPNCCSSPTKSMRSSY